VDFFLAGVGLAGDAVRAGVVARLGGLFAAGVLGDAALGGGRDAPARLGRDPERTTRPGAAGVLVPGVVGGMRDAGDGVPTAGGRMRLPLGVGMPVLGAGEPFTWGMRVDELS
jgi:hypothetical protein